jgi:hypothetical protein
MPLSHFAAMIIFALLVWVALACLEQQTMAGRIKYPLWSLALFLIIGVGIASLMYPFSRQPGFPEESRTCGRRPNATGGNRRR